MKFVSKEELRNLRRRYPVGTRVQLDRMDDFQAPPAGTCGTVKYVDDAGQIVVHWDTGSALSLIWGVDAFHIVKEENA